MKLSSTLKQVPILPLSALVFYLGVVLLWRFELIPGSLEIIAFLKALYDSYGLWGLAIAAFLEGIVYLGLYFPGSFIIALAIFFSDGSFGSLFMISLVVSATWTITCGIDYLLGRYIPFKKKKSLEKSKISKGFLLSFLHQNILAFYFFNEGIQKKTPWKLLIVFPIMLAWGLVVVSLFSLLRNPLKGAIDNPYVMITYILVWLLFAFVFEHWVNKK